MITTSCHCGAVRFEIARMPRKLTQCNCSICRRYGAIWAYYSRRSVRLSHGRDGLGVYTWRSRSLEFCHCRKCGCVTHHERAEKSADGSHRIAINMRNTDAPEAIAEVPIKMLDGASTWKVLGEGTRPHLFASPTARR